MPWRAARSLTRVRALSSASGRSNCAEVELHPARLDLGQIQDVVDEGEEVPAGGQYVLQVLLLLVVELAEHALEQHLGEADDGVERRAQLVGHVGEELGLVPVGDLELLGLLAQLLEEAHVLDGDHRLVGERPQQRRPACPGRSRAPGASRGGPRWSRRPGASGPIARSGSPLRRASSRIHDGMFASVSKSCTSMTRRSRMARRDGPSSSSRRG